MSLSQEAVTDKYVTFEVMYSRVWGCVCAPLLQGSFIIIIIKLWHNFAKLEMLTGLWNHAVG